MIEYLDYYRTLKEPHYAVLVTGDWGTGKTFQVRQHLPEKEAYYVSLFGLTSTDEVVAAVFTAMFPRRAQLQRLAEKIGEVSTEVPGVGSLAVNGLASGLMGAFLRQEVKTDKPIIFDDLERCALDVKEALGIINLYVEPHGCRVVVIAHDDKLMAGFAEAKEKIFGQTIQIEPQIDAAFDAFELNLQAPDREFVSKHKNSIIGVFLESDAKSLRILRHVIEDLARLVRSLRHAHIKNDQAMIELVPLFAAFDIEWRANRLDAADLHQRMNVEAAYSLKRARNQSVVVPKIIAANDRYRSVDLTSSLLQDDVLQDILVEGQFNAAEIQQSLDASSYFVQAKSSRPWQIVIHFDTLEDDVVSQGLAKMEKQLRDREVTDPGEVLHIFALQMLMASKGMISQGIGDVVVDSKAYIDDLLASDNLPPRELELRWRDRLRDSAFGIMYWVTDAYRSEFHDVVSHLENAREIALAREFPKKVPEILKTIETDSQRFFEQVCYTRSGNNPYASVPILKSIQPETFVAAWMRSPKSGWHWISDALKDRYIRGGNDGVATAEASWIVDVIRLMKDEASNAVGFARLRIERHIAGLEAPTP